MFMSSTDVQLFGVSAPDLDSIDTRRMDTSQTWTLSKGCALWPVTLSGPDSGPFPRSGATFSSALPLRRVSSGQASLGLTEHTSRQKSRQQLSDRLLRPSERSVRDHVKVHSSLRTSRVAAAMGQDLIHYKVFVGWNCRGLTTR